MNEKHDFYDFCRIIKRLREPDGCPWDRAQTHESLKPSLIEESYEAAEAIDTGDPNKMKDELGDVLLQVVMHAAIGAEQGEFDIDDVTDNVSKKMIERHPHVFGSASAETPGEVLDIWDSVKAKNRNQTKLSEILGSVSRALPSIKRAGKLQKKAAKALCPDETAADVLNLFRELSLNLTENSSESDFSDILFVLARLMTLCDIDPEDILRQKNEKFIKKIENIEKNSCNNSESLVKYRRVPTRELWL